VLQLQGSSQLGKVFSCGLPLNLPVFIGVKHLDLVFDIRDFLICCTTLLCLVIRSLWMYGSVQHNKMCLHVSGSIMWHNEQLTFGYCSLQNMYLRVLPMYWPYRYFKSWVI
jgi:hypothetical protein